jgi:hypothetical protein
MRKPSPVLMLLVMLVAPSAALATPLTFSFTGVAGADSSMNLGAGAFTLSGATFTASGSFVNDVDLFALVAQGVFASTVTYDFGALGSFTTDVGGDFYFQSCGGPSAIECVGLSNLLVTQGFQLNFTPPVAGNPDLGGIPIGTESADSSLFVTRTQTNSSGHSLTLATGRDARRARLSSVTATATSPTPIPEPGTWLLLGAGLAGLAARRRRK